MEHPICCLDFVGSSSFPYVALLFVYKFIFLPCMLDKLDEFLPFSSTMILNKFFSPPPPFSLLFPFLPSCYLGGGEVGACVDVQVCFGFEFLLTDTADKFQDMGCCYCYYNLVKYHNQKMTNDMVVGVVVVVVFLFFFSFIFYLFSFFKYVLSL